MFLFLRFWYFSNFENFRSMILDKSRVGKLLFKNGLNIFANSAQDCVKLQVKNRTPHLRTAKLTFKKWRLDNLKHDKFEKIAYKNKNQKFFKILNALQNLRTHSPITQLHRISSPSMLSRKVDPLEEKLTLLRRIHFEFVRIFTESQKNIEVEPLFHFFTE